MTEIDKSKIKVGDEIKIKYMGLVSPDWLEVQEGAWGLRLDIDGHGFFYITSTAVTVIDYRPNLKTLDDAVSAAALKAAKANEELEAAKSALNQAKHPNLKYAYGTRVYYPVGDSRTYGVVVPCPLDNLSWDTEDMVWARWTPCDGNPWVHWNEIDNTFKADD